MILNHRIYHSQGRHTNKSDAKKEARWLRSRGNLARVIKERKGWAVWTCNPRH